MDIRHGMALGLHVGTNGQLAALTINRDTRRGHFQPDELRLGKRLLPHVRNIYALQQRLSWMETLLGGFRAALDRLPTGALLLDRHGRIAFANREALRLKAERWGLGAHERHPVALWATDREPMRRLVERACAGVLAPSPETLLLHHEHGNPAATATTSPVPPATTAGWSESAVVAMLFVCRLHSRPQPAAEALRYIFGFTGAEAELAALLRDGATLAEASTRTGKSITTARTQLRALFAKAGTHRQAELIQVLAATVGGLAGF